MVLLGNYDSYDRAEKSLEDKIKECKGVKDTLKEQYELLLRELDLMVETDDLIMEKLGTKDTASKIKSGNFKSLYDSKNLLVARNLN